MRSHFITGFLLASIAPVWGMAVSSSKDPFVTAGSPLNAAQVSSVFADKKIVAMVNKQQLPTTPASPTTNGQLRRVRESCRTGANCLSGSCSELPGVTIQNSCRRGTQPRGGACRHVGFHDECDYGLFCGTSRSCTRKLESASSCERADHCLSNSCIAGQCARGNEFNIGAMINDLQYPGASDDDIEDAIYVASELLRENSGVSMKMIRPVMHYRVSLDPNDRSKNNIAADSAPQLEEFYQQHRSDFIHGAIDLRGNAMARTYGGHVAKSFDLTAIGYCNRFRSVSRGQQGRIYGLNVNWDSMYSACGFDFVGGQLRHVSSVALRRNDGATECQTRVGIACENSSVLGYSVCPGTEAVLYGRTRKMFAATSIVHELMHQFGNLAEQDHYGTMQCAARVGTRMQTAESRAFPEDPFQWWAGMCPDTYDNFRASNAFCEGDHDSYPDLSVSNIRQVGPQIVVQTCNRNAPTPSTRSLFFGVNITQNGRTIFLQTFPRAGSLGVGCDTVPTWSKNVSELGVRPGDVIRVRFIWDPSNRIPEQNESNNVLEQDLRIF